MDAYDRIGGSDTFRPSYSHYKKGYDMGKFHDLTDSLGYGEDGTSLQYPDTFIDDARSAYDEDMSIPSARISVLEADLAAASAEIIRLKAHNYELITAVPDEPGEPNSDDADNDSADDDNSDSDEGVDSLFGDNKDKE